MDHVVVVVGGEDADFSQLPVQVRADDHGEVGLVWCGDCGDGVVQSVADVVEGDPVLASTRQDLHCDNSSCRQVDWQPSESTRQRERSSRLIAPIWSGLSSDEPMLWRVPGDSRRDLPGGRGVDRKVLLPRSLTLIV